MDKQKIEDDFDQMADNATHAVMDAFEDLVLPDGDDRWTLLYRINDTLTAIFAEYKSV